ncbi:hypothetical protein OH76DRAFT_1559307 [Lentinus brumalis]|uniref:Uncharacterized protein n=1 Tax=Lentinus brumalis TaxID=2498619 RepID=A0A371CXW7_9APHY|nr:hypothetical protein OH76DRAFT_1559307 [Polyporus brumalis]
MSFLRMAPPPKSYIAMKLLPVRMVEDLNLDSQAQEEARNLERRVHEHMGNVRSRPQLPWPTSRWTTCCVDIISDNQSVAETDVVATILPNTAFSRADVERIDTEPGLAFPRSDAVYTLESRIDVRVRTEEKRCDSRKAVRRPVYSFECDYIDCIGLSHSSPAFVTLLKERSAAGDLGEEEVDDIAKLYSTRIRERDLLKGVPTATDPFRPQSTDNPSDTRLSTDALRSVSPDLVDIIGFGEDPDGPLVPLVEASLEIGDHFPESSRLTTPAQFLEEVRCVQSIIVRALRRECCTVR